MFLALLHFSGPGLPTVFAVDPPEVSIHCLVPGETAARIVNPALFFFSDQPVKFDAEITAPLRTHMILSGDLLQTTSGNLSARLMRNIPVSPELLFDNRTQITTACGLSAFPAVRGPTHLILKLYANIQGAPESTRPIASIDLFDYPRWSAREWQKTFAALLARGGLAQVAVFGGQSAIRRFLQRRQIAFEDLGLEWPETPDSKTLYLGDSPSPKPAQSASLSGARMALFFSDISDTSILPGVYSVSDAAGGTVVKVTLPALIAQLEENPRSQQLFLEIVRQALNPHAPLELTTSTLP